MSMILDGYPSNEKFIVYGTPSIRDRKFMACLLNSSSHLETGQLAICILIIK